MLSRATVRETPKRSSSTSSVSTCPVGNWPPVISRPIVSSTSLCSAPGFASPAPLPAPALRGPALLADPARCPLPPRPDLVTLLPRSTPAGVTYADYPVPRVFPVTHFGDTFRRQR
ncbi:hypothetical protein GCM10027174_00640 [Salinifilum aidingensis]